MFSYQLFLQVVADLVSIEYQLNQEQVATVGPQCWRQGWQFDLSLSSLFKKDRYQWFALSLSKKRVICSKSFWQFFTAFPLFMPKCKPLPSLFTKEQLWAICYRCSLQKSDGSDSLFSKIELLFHSFAYKKRAICSKSEKTKEQIPNPGWRWLMMSCSRRVWRS